MTEQIQQSPEKDPVLEAKLQAVVEKIKTYLDEEGAAIEPYIRYSQGGIFADVRVVLIDKDNQPSPYAGEQEVTA